MYKKDIFKGKKSGLFYPMYKKHWYNCWTHYMKAETSGGKRTGEMVKRSYETNNLAAHFLNGLH